MYGPVSNKIHETPHVLVVNNVKMISDFTAKRS
jgi:hypothetical protein